MLYRRVLRSDVGTYDAVYYFPTSTERVDHARFSVVRFEVVYCTLYGEQFCTDCGGTSNMGPVANGYGFGFWSPNYALLIELEYEF